MKVLRLTLYQTFRAILEGKKIYVARRNDEKRTFWAKSIEHAQGKFRTWRVEKMISKQTVKELVCRTFGHIPTNVVVRDRVANCTRCGAKLRVSYDMSYGNTTVEGVLSTNDEQGA